MRRDPYSDFDIVSPQHGDTYQVFASSHTDAVNYVRDVLDYCSPAIRRSLQVAGGCFAGAE